jgi:hypothetical protein
VNKPNNTFKGPQRGTASPAAEDRFTHTADGGLVRLVVDRGEVTGGVIIRTPCPWVYRVAHLVREDVE